MASVLKSDTLSLSLSDHLPVFVSWKSNDPNEALEQWYWLFNNVIDIHCLLIHVESKFDTSQNGFLLQ